MRLLAVLTMVLAWSLALTSAQAEINVTLISPSDGNVSNNVTQYVNYTLNCSANSSTDLANLSLWINSTGTWSQNQTANVTGLWNFSAFYLPLGPGYYIWNCQAGDNYSNYSFSSQNRTIRVNAGDSTPPDLWFEPPPPENASYVSSDWVYVNVSSGESLSWCGLGWYNGSWQNMSMNASGNSCFVNVTSLPSGNYTYRAYGNDSAGNMNVTGERVVNLDTVYPVVNITSPLNGTNYSTANLYLNLTYTESSPHTCWYQYNGTNTTLENCTGANFTALDHQPSVILIWMNDTAGNLNSSEPVTFSVCTESWACSGWSDCSGGVQSRICSDSYSCGTINDRPALSQSCSVIPVSGGGGGSPESSDVSKTWASILPGAAVSMSISKAGLGFTEIRMEVASVQSSVRITVAKADSKPADVLEVSGDVYQYVSVTADNLNSGSLKESSIFFNVSKSWITSNRIDKNKINLNRYANGMWAKLQTTFLEEDSKNARYMARTPGFSYFAITGEAISVPPPNQTSGGGCTGSQCEPVKNATCIGCLNETKKAALCKPSQIRCTEDHLLEICNEAGDNWTVVQSCSSEVTYTPWPVIIVPDWGWVIIVSTGTVAAGASVFLRRRQKDPFRI
jgi:PGF-pre-PGF domain-containing protein